MILQGLPGFITGRLNLFRNVLNEPSASWLMLATKLPSPGTVLQSTAYFLALSIFRWLAEITPARSWGNREEVQAVATDH